MRVIASSDGELLSVAAERGNLDAPVEHPRFAGFEVAGHSPVVLFAVLRRNQKLRQILPMTPSRDRPKVRAAAGLNSRIRLSWSMVTIQSSAVSSTAR